jgi:hypothetical protein
MPQQLMTGQIKSILVSINGTLVKEILGDGVLEATIDTRTLEDGTQQIKVTALDEGGNSSVSVSNQY